MTLSSNTIETSGDLTVTGKLVITGKFGSLIMDANHADHLDVWKPIPGACP